MSSDQPWTNFSWRECQWRELALELTSWRTSKRETSQFTSTNKTVWVGLRIGKAIKKLMEVLEKEMEEEEEQHESKENEHSKMKLLVGWSNGVGSVWQARSYKGSSVHWGTYELEISMKSLYSHKAALKLRLRRVNPVVFNNFLERVLYRFLLLLLFLDLGSHHFFRHRVKVSSTCLIRQSRE